MSDNQSKIEELWQERKKLDKKRFMYICARQGDKAHEFTIKIEQIDKKLNKLGVEIGKNDPDKLAQEKASRELSQSFEKYKKEIGEDIRKLENESRNKETQVWTRGIIKR